MKIGLQFDVRIAPSLIIIKDKLTSFRYFSSPFLFFKFCMSSRNEIRSYFVLMRPTTSAYLYIVDLSSRARVEELSKQSRRKFKTCGVYVVRPMESVASRGNRKKNINRVAWGRHHHPLTCSVVTMTDPPKERERERESAPHRCGCCCADPKKMERDKTAAWATIHNILSVQKFINIYSSKERHFFGNLIVSM